MKYLATIMLLGLIYFLIPLLCEIQCENLLGEPSDFKLAVFDFQVWFCQTTIVLVIGYLLCLWVADDANR